MKQFTIGALSALLLLSSCASDRQEPNAQKKIETTTTETETSHGSISVDLGASVGIDETAFGLKALNFSTDIGTRAPGHPNAGTKYVVPLLDLQEGDLVKVHTFVSSDDGLIGAATLEWTYKKGPGGDRAKDRLVIGESYGGKKGKITLSTMEEDFKNVHRQWYISGIIGGTLTKLRAWTSGSYNYKVSFTPTRALTRVTDSQRKVKEFEVPFSFPWTELRIHQHDKSASELKDGRNGVTAQLNSTDEAKKKVKFTPRGSIIAYKLGNHDAVSYKPKGFTVQSNAFGDEGAFVLEKYTGEGKQIEWKHTKDLSKIQSISYTFKTSADEPGILNESIDDNGYYCAWVMHSQTPKDKTITRITIQADGGQSFLSNYRSKANHGVKEALAYTLSAKAIQCPDIPIRYVTDFNVAGAGAASRTDEDHRRISYKIWHRGVPIEGTSGCPLRFANLDRQLNEVKGNDPNVVTPESRAAHQGYKYDARLSGYYNWYVVTDTVDTWLDPSGRRVSMLDQDIYLAKNKKVKVRDHYFVPAIEDWAGVFPGGNHEVGVTENDYQTLSFDNVQSEGFNWGKPNPQVRFESFRVGGQDNKRYMAKACYTGPKQEGNDSYVYALRYLAVDDSYSKPPTVRKQWGLYSHDTFDYKTIKDNNMACVVRYVRRNSHTKDCASNRVEVTVIYLGTFGRTLLNERGWGIEHMHEKFAELEKDAVNFPCQITKVFPTIDKVDYSKDTDNEDKDLYEGGAFTPTIIQNPYIYGAYWSLTRRQGDTLSGVGRFMHWSKDFVTINTGQDRRYGMAVRLFHKTLPK